MCQVQLKLILISKRKPHEPVTKLTVMRTGQLNVPGTKLILISKRKAHEPVTKLTVMRTGQPNVPGKLVNPEKEKAAARMRCVKSAPSNMPEHSIQKHPQTRHRKSTLQKVQKALM